jgi:hypothetical protein
MQQRIEAVRRDAFAAGYASDPGSRVALGAQGWNQCLMCRAAADGDARDRQHQQRSRLALAAPVVPAPPRRSAGRRPTGRGAAPMHS